MASELSTIRQISNLLVKRIVIPPELDKQTTCSPVPMLRTRLDIEVRVSPENLPEGSQRENRERPPVKDLSSGTRVENLRQPTRGGDAAAAMRHHSGACWKMDSQALPENFRFVAGEMAQRKGRSKKTQTELIENHVF